jgi:small nuclear ribonucleoprotein (snRNP)-like protein
MTNDIIEIIIFLIPRFLCFEVFYPLSGFDINLSDKKYYFICIFISFIIYGIYSLHSGIRYIQELESRQVEIWAVIKLYTFCIVASFILASLVRRYWFRNYCLILREPWSFFLEEINKNEASEVTVITSDGSEYYGRLRMFSHKKNEQREIIIEDVTKIIRNEKTEAGKIEVDAKEIDIGAKEILFIKDDIRRIIYNKSTRREPNRLEKFLHIRR